MMLLIVLVNNQEIDSEKTNHWITFFVRQIFKMGED